MSKSLRALWIFLVLATTFITLKGVLSLDWPSSLMLESSGGVIRYFGCISLAIFLVISVSVIGRLNYLFVGCILAVGIALIAGQIWPLIVATFFFYASYFLGGIIFNKFTDIEISALYKILLGAGIYGSIVSIFAHFPINYPGLYGAGIILPILFSWRKIVQINSYFYHSELLDRVVGDRFIALLQCLLTGVALTYFVVALMPESGWDALVTHLFVPSQLFLRHSWGFDASYYAWAVMPMLADWVYSIGYMLGGESASRLINVGFIFLLLIVVKDLVIWAGGKAKGGLIAALILISTPITFLEGSSLHVEAVWSVFLLVGTLAFLKAIISKEEIGLNLILSGIFLGFALATKLITIIIFPGLFLIGLFYCRTLGASDLRKKIGVAVAAFLILGSIPYLNALWMTGNPIFPFFNKFFQSSLFPIINFKDMRWDKGVTWDIIYSITFKSDQYQETGAGAPGFQFLLFLFPSIFLLLISKCRKGLFLIFLGFLFFALVFYTTASYLRYVYPALIIFIAVISLAIERALNYGGRFCSMITASILGLLIFLNLVLLNVSSHYPDFQIFSIFNPDVQENYVRTRLPERAAVNLVNQLNVSHTPVLFLSAPYAAGLNANALHSNWYNSKFQDLLFNIKSEKEALNLLIDNSVEYIILNKDWGNKQKNTDSSGHEEQRIFIQNITSEIATFGSISLRKIDAQLLFTDELLKNPDFQSTVGWNFSPGAVFDPKTKSVLVSEPNPVTQSVAIKGSRQYRNSVVAKCALKPTVGRVQVNWYDVKGRFIKADGITFNCTEEWSKQFMTVTSPPNATSAVIYTSSHFHESLLYKSNSFTQ